MTKESWHQWRSKGLGSSDSPIIMGVSPWCTPYQLWERKCGIVTREQNSNFAIERGNDLEPKARAQYELEHDIEMPATLVEHAKHPWLRSSLDGYNEKASRVLEIKCPGRDDHAKAVEGKVPDKYWPQCQQQLLVTGAKHLHYYSFDGVNGVVVEVLPDLDYCARLFLALESFWDMVQKRQPPPFTDRDIIKVRDPDLKELAETWRAAKGAKDAAEELEAKTRSKLLAAINERPGQHPKLLIGNVKASRLVRKGNVKYLSMPQLSCVDEDEFNRYREPSKSYWTLAVGGDENQEP